MTSRNEGVGGLAECLQPLCTRGMAEAGRRRQLRAETVRQVDECKLELAAISDREIAAFDDKQKGNLDDVQYAGIMERLRARRAEAAQKMAEAEKTIADAVDEKRTSAAQFLAILRGGAPVSLPPLQYRELIRLAVERVVVHEDSILIRLLSGGEWSLPRLRIRNSRPLPLPLSVGQESRTGKVLLAYAGGSGEGQHTVYDDENLNVVLWPSGTRFVVTARAPGRRGNQQPSTAQSEPRGLAGDGRRPRGVRKEGAS